MKRSQVSNFGMILTRFWVGFGCGCAKDVQCSCSVTFGPKLCPGVDHGGGRRRSLFQWTALGFGGGLGRTGAFF